MAEIASFEPAIEAPKITGAPSGRAQKADGWLYLGVGLGALVGAICVRVFMGNSVEALTFMGVGLASAGVLSGLGLFRLAQVAPRDQPTFSAYAVNLIVSFYLLCFYCVMCGYLLTQSLAPYFRTETGVWAWAIPTYAAVGMLLRWPRRAQGEQKIIRRTACFMTISWLLLAATLGAVASENISWVLLGAFAPYQLSIWDPSHALLRGMAGISMLLSIAFYGLTLWNLRCIRILKTAHFISGCVLLYCWLYLAPFLILLSCFSVRNPAAHAGLSAAVLSLTAAGLFGAVIARTWRPKPSRLTWWIATATAALLLLVFVPLTLATAVDCGVLGYRETVQRDWMWYAPEFIRAPVMRSLIRIRPNCQSGIYMLGLPATEELAAECVSAKPFMPANSWGGVLIWQAWGLRDPAKCLAVALAVPPAQGSGGIPAGSYDYGAGSAVGKLADDAEILKRLTGNWSYQFFGGMLYGLSHERAARFKNEIAQAFTTRAMDRQCWYAYSSSCYEGYEETLLNILAHPHAFPSAQFPSSTHWNWRRTAPELILAELKSDDPKIRAVCTQAGSSSWSTWSAQGNSSWRHAVMEELIQCASGSRAGSTANEQRQAAVAISNFPGMRPIAFQNQFGKQPPLSATELRDITWICDKAREYLQQHADK